MANMDEFYDDEGNLAKTAWGIEQERAEAEEERKRKEQEHKRNIRAANRQISIDETNARTEEKREANRRRRKLRDEWLAMPKWVKSIEVTPLKDPPTEGRKEKLMYSISGKVTLTENERRKRITQAKRLKIAISDHKKLNRSMGHDVMNLVTVVSLGDNAGGTMVSRGLSKVMAMSRKGLGIHVCMDFGGEENNLEDWYDTSHLRTAFLKQVLNVVRGKYNFTPSEVLASGGESEYYLSNHNTSQRRATIGFDEVSVLQEWLSGNEGVTFLDCDPNNIKATSASMMFSTTTVLVIPPTNGAIRSVDEFISSVEEIAGEDIMGDILSNTIIVVSGDSPNMRTRDGIHKMEELSYGLANGLGIGGDRAFVLPFDRGLGNKPLNIDKVSFTTSHILREIGGLIVDDAIEENN